MTRLENEGREELAIDELLRELAELRELDRRRQAHVPGSAAHDAATLEVDLKSRRLFDRFRDLKQRRASRAERSHDNGDHRPHTNGADRRAMNRTLSPVSQTRQFAARWPGTDSGKGNGGSHLR